MKNTVVLKDVKSNLIEEAIIVFRENVKIKEKQLLKGKKRDEEEEKTEKLALDEAQNVILNYIDEYENEKKRIIQKNKIKVLKIINISLVILLIIATIF